MGSNPVSLLTTSGDRLGCAVASAPHGWALASACTADVNGAQLAGLVRVFRPSDSSTEAAASGTRQTIYAPSPTAGARFGSSVAASSAWLLVGATGEVSDAGGAYLYSITADQVSFSSSFERRLAPILGASGQSSLEPGSRFGAAVALRGSIGVIGAPGLSSTTASTITYEESGSAYVFDLRTGRQLARLQPTEAANGVSPLLGCLWFGASVSISAGAIAVGAPRARPPCAGEGTQSSGGYQLGAAFVFETSALLSRVNTSLFASEVQAYPLGPPASERFNQTAHLTAPEASSSAAAAASVVVESGGEFGAAVVLVQNVWRGATMYIRTILLVGAPGAAGGRGAVYPIGPFNHSDGLHDGIGHADAMAPRLDAPQSFGGYARLGSALAVEPSSGLALLGAPGASTRKGPASGAALRSWLLRTSKLPMDEIWDGSALAAVTARLAASSPLDGIAERTLWGANTWPADNFGASVAIGSDGYSVCGAPKHGGGGALLFGGAVYVTDASIASPVTPPASPPTPISPPPAPPGMPPYPPQTSTGVIVASIAAATLFLIVIGSIAGCMLATYFAQKAARMRRERARRKLQKGFRNVQALIAAKRGNAGMADIAALASLGQVVGRGRVKNLTNHGAGASRPNGVSLFSRVSDGSLSVVEAAKQAEEKEEEAARLAKAKKAASPIDKNLLGWIRAASREGGNLSVEDVEEESDAAEARLAMAALQKQLADKEADLLRIQTSNLNFARAKLSARFRVASMKTLISDSDAAAVGDAGQAGMESTTAPSADAAPGEVPSSSLEMDQELNPPAKRASRPTTPRQFAKVVPL